MSKFCRLCSFQSLFNQNHRYEPPGGSGRKVRGSPKSSVYIICTVSKENSIQSHSVFSVCLYSPSCCHIKHTLQAYIKTKGRRTAESMPVIILPTTEPNNRIKNMAPGLIIISFKILDEWEK